VTSRYAVSLSVVTVVLAASAAVWWSSLHAAWTDAELAAMESLWIATLGEPPADPTNEFAADPQAQALGHRLFFDTRLSGNGAISCATCHQPQKRFTDGLTLSRAIGTTRRNAPSVVGVGYSPWLYWDGRKDSLWSQALAPLEDAAEHGGNRVDLVRVVAQDEGYVSRYSTVFGALPDMQDARRFPPGASPLGDARQQAAWLGMAELDRAAVNRAFANIGKAIAAYEMLLRPAASRFDAYVDALLDDQDVEQTSALLSRAERRGLRLFIGDAGCTQCHNGPMFTNNAFHNTGLLSAAGALPDRGRSAGLREVRQDPFNCVGDYSDDTDCAELRFAKSGPEMIGAMRTPSLRNVGGTQPYGHKGQQPGLTDVLEQYNLAPEAMIGHNEAKPLELWWWQLSDLQAFLGSLDAPIATDPQWLRPPEKVH